MFRSVLAREKRVHGTDTETLFAHAVTLYERQRYEDAVDALSLCDAILTLLTRRQHPLYADVVPMRVKCYTVIEGRAKAEKESKEKNEK